MHLFNTYTYIEFVVQLLKAGKQAMAMIGIVPEELKEENYEFWKVCLKSYLVGKGLWDVVSGEATSEEATLVWKTKNAQALHAIQLACGSRAYSKYKKNTHISAKFAWDHLVDMHHIPTIHAEVSHKQDAYGNAFKIVVRFLLGYKILIVKLRNFLLSPFNWFNPWSFFSQKLSPLNFFGHFSAMLS